MQRTCAIFRGPYKHRSDNTNIQGVLDRAFFQKDVICSNSGNKFSNYKQSNTKYERIKIQACVQADKSPALLLIFIYKMIIEY